MLAPPVLCLASASPRRRELLAQIGVPHLVLPAAIDESVLPGEEPRDYVLRIACAKARQVAEHAHDADHADHADAGGLPVLAADTSVVVGTQLLGKPRAFEDAMQMLEMLSDATHTVLSAVALAARGAVATRLCESQVRFRRIELEERRAYCATTEPFDKAGGYAIQGLAAVFVEWIRGSYSGVMGLPLYETAQLLRAAGIPYWHTMAT
jgi:septum formation protein